MKETENNGIHIPILINAPKKIPYTVEVFDKISIFGLGCLMINYPIFFVKRADSLEMYMQDYQAKIFYGTSRFKHIPFYKDESAELVWCKIPIGDNLSSTITKYYSHLIID